jgi:hypothetical protein
MRCVWGAKDLEGTRPSIQDLFARCRSTPTGYRTYSPLLFFQ